MLILVRSQTKDESTKQALESLLGRVSSDVWLGEITTRTYRAIERLLINDRTSDGFVCRLGRTMNVSYFYSIISGTKREVMFFEIYKNKSLLKKES